MSRPLQSFPVVLLVIVLAGCAGPGGDAVREGVAPSHGALLSAVPFIAQTDYQCGSAALAMVLRYHGLAVDEGELTRALYRPSVRGVLNLELLVEARRRGLEARAVSGTLEAAKAELRHGRPVIVLQDLGAGPFSVPHFAVLVGYDDRAGVVILHSGTTPFSVQSYAEFARTWDARRRWMLLVRSPDRAA